MNMITLLASALLDMFWGWNSAHFMLLALAFWGFYQLGKKHAQRPAQQRQRYSYSPSATAQRPSYNADDYKTPAITRRQNSDN